MEYQVVFNCNLEKLVDLVNQEIGKGWIPQGGIAVEVFGFTRIYHQAMVKTPKPS